MIKNIKSLVLMLQDFVNFFGKNRINTIIVIFLTIFVIGIGLLFYFFYIQINLLTEINQTVNPTEENQIEFAKTTTDINNELKELLYFTNSDRIKIYQFHNGEKSISNVPFRFASCTHEVVSKGTTYECSKLQRQPASGFVTDSKFNNNNNFEDYEQGHVICSNIDNVENQVAFNILESQRVNFFCTFGIFSNGEASSLLTINYLEEPTNSKDLSKIKNEIKFASREIAEILYN